MPLKPRRALILTRLDIEMKMKNCYTVSMTNGKTLRRQAAAEAAECPENRKISKADDGVVTGHIKDGQEDTQHA